MDVRCDREGSGSRFGIGPVDRPGLRRWLESRWTGLISAAVAGVVAAGFGGVALVAPAVAGPRARSSVGPGRRRANSRGWCRRLLGGLASR